jgi:GntR family histidine utilization transcriptional repressor
MNLTQTRRNASARSLTETDSISGEAPFAGIKRFLKDGLARGLWPAGALMPSEHDLVRQFGVSRMTVGRAIRELQAEGLVRRVQGVGTFAASLQKVSSTLTIRDLQEEIESRGHHYRSVVHRREVRRASSALANQMGVPKNSELFHTVIVHYENDLALQCEDRFVNPQCAPNYLSADFSRMTPTHYLFRHTSLWRAQYTIESSPPAPMEAKLLNIARSSPCLIMVRRTLSRDSVITLARLVHPGDRYQLSGEFNL